MERIYHKYQEYVPKRWISPISDKEALKDRRHKHPAIRVMKELTGHYYQREYWDDIILFLDRDFDKAKLIECRDTFAKRGNDPKFPQCWLFKWYFEGIPPEPPKMNWKPQSHAKFKVVRMKREKTPLPDKNAILMDLKGLEITTDSIDWNKYDSDYGGNDHKPVTINTALNRMRKMIKLYTYKPRYKIFPDRIRFDSGRSVHHGLVIYRISQDHYATHSWTCEPLY